MSYSEEAQREFATACLRTARARMQAVVCELDEAGIALKYGMLTPAAAVAWMNELGALQYINQDLWREPDTKVKAA
jgi:hypothetical protein